MPCPVRPGFILASHSVRHRAAWLHPGFTFASPLYSHASARLHFSFGVAAPWHGQADLTSSSLQEETAWQHLASPCFTLADATKRPCSTLHRQETAWKHLLLPASPCFSRNRSTSGYWLDSRLASLYIVIPLPLRHRYFSPLLISPPLLTVTN